MSAEGGESGSDIEAEKPGPQSTPGTQQTQNEQSCCQQHFKKILLAALTLVILPTIVGIIPVLVDKSYPEDNDETDVATKSRLHPYPYSNSISIQFDIYS